MSVLIKGMEIPTRCLECPMYDDFSFSCKLSSFGIPARYNYDGATRPEWCQLVDLGKHGRLIDADALIKFVEDRYEITWESDCYEGGIKDACIDILEKIDTMPTVIEAEGE